MKGFFLAIFLLTTSMMASAMDLAELKKGTIIKVKGDLLLEGTRNRDSTSYSYLGASFENGMRNEGVVRDIKFFGCLLLARKSYRPTEKLNLPEGFEFRLANDALVFNDGSYFLIQIEHGLGVVGTIRCLSKRPHSFTPKVKDLISAFSNEKHQIEVFVPVK